MKKVLRWILRRDADASNTRMGGWITRFEMFLPIVIGVKYGIMTGLAVFGLMWVLRSLAGYLDLNFLHVSKYTTDYISKRAPANVVILNERSKHRRN